MAIGFMRVRECKKNAASKYDYITRSGKYSSRDDLVDSGSENMPAWALKSPRRLWTAADNFEKGNKCKTLIIALPNEMPNEKLKEYTKKILREMFPGHAYTYAIHDPAQGGKLSGNPNKHVHIMICERTMELDRPNLPPDLYFKKGKTMKDGRVTGGYRKDKHMTKTTRHQWLDEIKAQYARLMNQALKEELRDSPTIKFNNYKRTGGEKSRHLGPKVVARAAKGIESDHLQAYIDRQLLQANKKYDRAVAKAKKEYAQRPSVGEYVVTFLSSPSTLWNRKKREEKLWPYQTIRMKEQGVYHYYVEDVKAAEKKRLEASTKTAYNVMEHIRRWCKHQKIDISKLNNPAKYQGWINQLAEIENRELTKNYEIEQKTQKIEDINTHKAIERPSETKIEQSKTVQRTVNTEKTQKKARGIHRKKSQSLGRER